MKAACAALALAACGIAACSSARPPAAPAAFVAPIALMDPSARANDGRVIFVTLDGVRARDVFDGAIPSARPALDAHASVGPEWLMPRTFALIEGHGVALGAERAGCGTVRTGSVANVSLPGYLVMFTGHPTACRNNHCDAVLTPTVLDEASARGLSAASIGSWDVLDHAVSNGSASVFVAAGTTDPTTNPYPGDGHYRPDALTMPIALRYLLDRRPRVMHIGLGDADEWAHRNDYGAYLAAVRAEDAFLGDLADALARMGDAGAKTTVIVTTDHGRNEDFKDHGALSESASHSFILAFGARVPPQGVACGARDVTLADIAPTIRALVGLPPDDTEGAGRAIAEITGGAR